MSDVGSEAAEAIADDLFALISAEFDKLPIELAYRVVPLFAKKLNEAIAEAYRDPR